MKVTHISQMTASICLDNTRVRYRLSWVMEKKWLLNNRLKVGKDYTFKIEVRKDNYYITHIQPKSKLRSLVVYSFNLHNSIINIWKKKLQIVKSSLILPK